jgi:hypothetical protein
VPGRRPQGFRGQVFLVTDGGLHPSAAASGNFGQVVRKNYPVVIGNKVSGAQREIASVVVRSAPLWIFSATGWSSRPPNRAISS